MKHVIVIGGGASGMMAAITAAKNGARVTIIEHNDRVGKKILSTGNGKCNFTNVHQEPIFYNSDNVGFPWKVLEHYTSAQTIAFFTGLGIYSKNRNGCLYPYSDQAGAVLDVLRLEIEQRGIEVCYNCHVTEIKKTAKGFQITAKCKSSEKKKNECYNCQAVILATGSKAAPFTGSDGSGYALAKAFGHSVMPVLPALVQLRCKGDFFKSISGVRIQGKVTIVADKSVEASDTGEIQLTDYGISGIPVFQVSRFAARALYEKKQVKAILDFMPDFTTERLELFLEKRIAACPKRSMEHFFTGLFHKKVALLLLKTARIRNEARAEELTDKEKKMLVGLIKTWETQIEKTNPFEQAQVCAGGVNTEEINPETMESLLVPGIYFAGELMDVDGMCGGYNLQWAWTSGYLAGKGAAND